MGEGMGFTMHTMLRVTNFGVGCRIRWEIRRYGMHNVEGRVCEYQ